MSTIGIFFGTYSGTTRLIAKKIAKQINKRLGDGAAAKPLNINRVQPQDLLAYKALIIGTPTYGEGVLPGKVNETTKDASWMDAMPGFQGLDFSAHRIALYGTGDQETYPDHFVDGLRELHTFFTDLGAQIIGDWSIEGYEFNTSKAVQDGRFVGLVIDHHLQHLLTDQRISDWLDDVLGQLLPETEAAAQ